MNAIPHLARAVLTLWLGVAVAGCLGGPGADPDEAQVGEAEAALMNTGGGSACPYGYTLDVFGWCVLVDNPGPIPPMGGGSCIAPTCKTGCGTRRTACLRWCEEDAEEGCLAACYDEFAGCIDSCCS